MSLKKSNSKLVSLSEALEQDKNKIKDRHENYLNPGLAKMLGLLSFNKKFIKAKGVEVWDDEGNKYLDFLGGYGSLNLGHNPEKVIKALEEVREVPNIIQSSLNPLSGALGENLARVTPGNLKHTFFCNSGAEAVEGAIKLVRKASGKSKIIHCEGSFHGKTLGALSVSGREKYKKDFTPLIPGCIEVPFGNTSELKKVVEAEHEEIAALILEPIKGEGGVIIPPEGYLKKARELCDEFGILMIIDEIQTGLGRTGEMFACEYEEVIPDVLCLAKSLGGGIIPLGAFITTEELWCETFGKFEEALLHTSTFGGNTRACAAGVQTLEEIYSNGLYKEVREKGDYLLNQLLKLKSKYSLIEDIRGRGLLIGVEFKSGEESFINKLSCGAIGKLSKEYTGALIAERLKNEHNIITAYTLNNPNVIRLEPPLIVKKAELDKVVNALDEVLKNSSNFFSLAAKSSKKIVKNFVKKRS